MAPFYSVLNNSVVPDRLKLFKLEKSNQIRGATLRSPSSVRVFASISSERQEGGIENGAGTVMCFANSKEVIETEVKVFVRSYARPSVVIVKGKGCRLYDMEGREYLDLTSGIAVNSLGHGDPGWVKAVTEQATVLTHVSNVYHSIPQVIRGRYGETTISPSPFSSRCLFFYLVHFLESQRFCC